MKKFITYFKKKKDKDLTNIDGASWWYKIESHTLTKGVSFGK